MVDTYLEQIVLWIGMAIASFGGSAISIGAIICWIRKVVTAVIDKLYDSTYDYTDKAAELDKVASAFLEAGSELQRVGGQIIEYKTSLDELSARLEESEKNNEALRQAICLMAQNTPYMVSNGTAGEIIKLLAVKDNSIEVGDVSDEPNA